MYGISILDILSGIILIVFFVIGFKRGFIRELAEIAGVGTGIFCGIFFEDLFRPIAIKLFGNIEGIQIISFVMLFFIVAVFIVLIGLILSRFVKWAGIESTDKILGGILGLLKVFAGIVLLCMLFFLFENEKIKSFILDSYTGKVVEQVLKKIDYQEKIYEIKDFKL